MQPLISNITATGAIPNEFSDRPAPNGTADTLKVVVLMTDGENTRTPIPSMPGVERISVDLVGPAAEMAAELGNEKAITNTARQLTKLHLQEEQYEEAIVIYEMLAEIWAERGDVASQAYALGQSAGTYAEMGDLDAALEKYAQSLVLAEEAEDVELVILIHKVVAKLHSDMGNKSRH